MRLLRLSSLAAALAALPTAAPAWIYPEHREIAVAGIQKLPPPERAALESLWVEARKAIPGRLCATASAGDQGAKPACIDFAAFPAMSGDHSCSPKEVAERTLRSTWILEVARVAVETRYALDGAKDRDESLNAIATSNLKLQAADPEYVSRAGANNAHFLLPRLNNDPSGYARAALSEGAPLNAMGLYVQYHMAALELAQRYAANPPPPAERPEAALRILATEGYALHWIEDIFAAGHVVGTWGSAAWRKGTHDYYNEFGHDGVTWAGDPVVLFGDSFMRDGDVRRGSDAVVASLEQLAAALTPGDELGTLAISFGRPAVEIFAFDSCVEEKQPSVQGLDTLSRHLVPVLKNTPVPGRGEGDVHLPRFREELGPFIGAFASATGNVGWGGLGTSTAQFYGSLSAGLRFGFGAESLTGSVGTGLIFLDAGITMQSAQTDACNDGPICSVLGSSALFPRVPARTGLRLGIRMPFYVIPFDMLVLGPILAIASPEALSSVGVAAASGGLIPYQRSFGIGVGTLEFILGREVDLVWYGLISEVIVLVPIGPPPMPDSNLGATKLRSLVLNFPFLEWTPFRTFATQLVFATVIQLGFGVEIPLGSPVLLPEGYGNASLSPSYNFFLRAQFDGRYFFGSRDDLAPPR
ncbi:MAG TPA: hypothetical protein VFM53_14070 [Anaeromyxobacteraceae bacterium]|nr:hypothetical protein [Anaeromyxobacteraceae bacterium]